MALRWATASAEVNRKPDEGVTGSVYCFVRQDGDPQSGSPSREEPPALRAATLNPVRCSGSGFALSPVEVNRVRARRKLKTHPADHALPTRAHMRNLRQVRLAVALTGHVRARRVATAPSTERPRSMVLRAAPGVSRWSVGKPDEGVTGSVHFRFRPVR
jgi:hypothetical protein